MSFDPEWSIRDKNEYASLTPLSRGSCVILPAYHSLQRSDEPIIHCDLELIRTVCFPSPGTSIAIRIS